MMRFGILVILACFAIKPTQAQSTRPAARSSIVGSWELVSFESRDSFGTAVYPLGKQPQGILVYGSDGRVVAQLFDPNRPRFASGDRARGTDAEVRAAFNGSFAYYGRYVVDTLRRMVTHRVEGASFPNWIGTDLVREYRLDIEDAVPDRLTITTVPQVVAGHRIVTTLVWQRAR